MGNWAIRYAALNRHVEVVELLLRYAPVVEELKLDPRVVHDGAMRRAAAIAQCVVSEPFRKEMMACYRVVYKCVRVELYAGWSEQVCECLWAWPLAREAVQVQRELAARLQRLRACKI
eukprot:TRINITY_DN5312_c0_g2_i1.p1 TRINITY_DN5312_c0_g2~~TRINITY_DN5312_c0_g2_i1.p1  ORF type:complete len:118 (-),score=21.63 TRINITY_DN5312_c0_g2_i1:143-496(-)